MYFSMCLSFKKYLIFNFDKNQVYPFKKKSFVEHAFGILAEGWIFKEIIFPLEVWQITFLYSPIPISAILESKQKMI